MLPLTYRLHGPDADSFDLHTTIRADTDEERRGLRLRDEAQLFVTVTVSDGQGGSDATAVTINVTNVPEAPSTPARPTVRATPGSSRSLDVTWSEPDNMGPAITGYDVRYREGNSGAFRTIEHEGTGTTATIAPADDISTSTDDERLTPRRLLRGVRAGRERRNRQPVVGCGHGRTSIGNSEPVFNDRSSLTETDPTTTERTVAENTRPGQSVGRAVVAVDGNGDGRTYRLVAADDAPRTWPSSTSTSLPGRF